MIFVIVIITYNLTRLIIAYNNLLKNNFVGVTESNSIQLAVKLFDCSIPTHPICQTQLHCMYVIDCASYNY